MNAIVLVAIVLMTAAMTALSADPEVRTELRKGEDKVAIASTNGTMLITVTTVSGIGGAKLASSGGAWPTNITIRLSVRSLESFEIKTPKRSLTGSLGHSESLASSQTNDYIQIIVPHSLIDEKPEQLEVSWIDAFRH